MKIYVTGIAGFLGSHIAEAMAVEHEVTGCDNLSAGEEAHVPPEIEWAIADCCDYEGMRAELVGMDVVYHAAAHPHEGLSVFSPRVIGESIYGASVSVFSAAIAAGVKRIVFCSSMSRYGDNPLPFEESQATNPKDPYAVAKVASEDTLRCLARAHGIEYVIAVPHNIVGPRQKYDDPFRNVAAIMANRMLSGLQPIVYGDGLQTRCFSDVRDVISVLTSLATRPGISGEVYNVGPDEEVVTIEQLGRLIAKAVGVDWKPLRLPERPCEVKHAHCSSDKIRREFGYATGYSLEETIESLVSYISARGPKPFDYYLPVEIVTDKTPKFWTKAVK
jgi:UDP-glucose 4-epimerase